ncbi:MAG: PEP-CTERM sorting domain-containing protein [Bryobacteraceae bacterium]|nr:PEP-CTERM sorting domain-containing protein [Bryobacteraceae bacterium]
MSLAFALRTFAALIVVLISSTSVSAATIVPDGGNLFAFRRIAPTGETFDFRGLLQVAVSDPGPLGTAVITDNAGGTDLTFAVIPFGIESLLAVDSAFVQVAGIAFDITSVTITPTSLSVNAQGIPIAPNPTTDPALSRLIGGLTFNFSLLDFVPVNSTDFLATYVISSIEDADAAIPEPSTALMLATAGCALLLVRRFRS